MRASVCCCLFVVWLSYDTTAGRATPGLRSSRVPRQCRPVYCNLYCEHGYATDNVGCPFCACDDPCKEFKCPAPSRCVLEPVYCIRAPCPPVPVCRVSR
ncbi:hypothetical protein LSAT2_013212, partial [Lamellibrachia satsuma]